MNARARARRTARGCAWLAILPGAAIAEVAEDIRDIRGPKAVSESWELPAALAAAIDDALGLPNAVTELPITPQRLKRLIGESTLRRTSREA